MTPLDPTVRAQLQTFETIVQTSRNLVLNMRETAGVEGEACPDLDNLRFVRAGVSLYLDLDALLFDHFGLETRELPEPVKFALFLLATGKLLLLFPNDMSYSKRHLLKMALELYVQIQRGERGPSLAFAPAWILVMLNQTALGIPYDDSVYRWVMSEAFSG